MSKIIFILLGIILLSCNSQNNAEGIIDHKENILFIGNSYTYRNAGVDRHLKRLTEGMKNLPSTFITRAAQGKFHLHTHWNDPETLNLLQTQKWDKVILQEYSSGPTKDEKQFFKFGEKWKKRLMKLNPKTKILLYATWGYKKARRMTDSLDVQYERLKDKMHVSKVPVGLLWKSLKNKINLYDGDGAHPNRKGTFLTACLFYEYLFDKDVRLTKHVDDRIPLEIQNKLKQWAHDFKLEQTKVKTSSLSIASK